MASSIVNKDDPAHVGNQLFRQNKYSEALDAYSTAIEKHPDVAKLYLNRALTYWKLNRLYDALMDAMAGLELEPDYDKLIYRKCKALLALRRFSDAGQFLDESIGRLDHLKNDIDFKALVDDMNRLKTEYERGQYDLPAMIKEAKESERLDNHADYYAWSKIEIRNVAGKGRGMVAKEKIKAGELLIACKAFVFVDTESECGQSIDRFGRHSELRAFSAMVEEVRKKLTHRPDLAEEFYRLYAGPKLGHLEKWTEGESKLIDEDRIKEIIDLNNFCAEDSIFGKFPSTNAPMGLWLIPSYINHTCDDTNCFRYFVGDYMFVRAPKSIEMDEEILLYYVPPTEPFEKRQSACKKYGFDCHCRLCVVDQEDPLDEIMQQRMNQIRSLADDVDERKNHPGYNPCVDIQTLEKFLQELLRCPLRDSHLLARRIQELAATLSVRVNPNESFRLMTDYINVLKSNGVFRHALEMSKVMYQFQAPRLEGKSEQEKWKNEARGIAKLIYGDERMADLILNEG